MFQPKIPTMPQPTGLVSPPTAAEATAVTPAAQVPRVVPVAPALSRPAVQVTPGSALALVGAGIAVVLVVGAVLVSMLLAVAVTAASVAVCAVAIRSILRHR